ncbi:PTS sugar transporter subunit IIA [uncultured Clostridium sp.]|uniref:PTS sugar transporter subunit IIA n=1 Tax=uncultured Clostridium sp. TaxID=59620 RepID=UPI0028E67A45|nr:PTS sugar transporter subunit IIA [uncultured Clostridium sp.]
MLVKVVDRVEDYKEAIKLSCDILEENGIVEKRYYDSILKKIEDLGPYFCIADGVAMPHARPEDGTLKEGVSVVKLNNPVDFLGKEINVFFTLSAKDNDSHLDLLRKIAEVCMNKEKLNIIINSKCEKEIKEVL